MEGNSVSLPSSGVINRRIHTSSASHNSSSRAQNYIASNKNSGTLPSSTVINTRKRLRLWAWFCLLVVLLFLPLGFRDELLPETGGAQGTYALSLQPEDFIPINNTTCRGVHVSGIVPMPRVSESVFYVTAKFGVGPLRWNGQLQHLGCHVFLSSAIPEHNILVFRDVLPRPLQYHPRYKRHRRFLWFWWDASGRGAGYWFWKPLLMLSVLQKDDVPFGSYIIYTDADRPDVMAYTRDVIEAMDHRGHDFVIQQWGWSYPYSEIEWTKGDIFEHFGVYGRWDENNVTQYSANFYVVRKSPAIIEFFQKWATLMEDYHLVSDQPSYMANHPTFMENRHDQSMLSLLLKIVYRDGGPTKTAVEIDFNNSGDFAPFPGIPTFSYSLEQSRPNELQS